MCSAAGVECPVDSALVSAIRAQMQSEYFRFTTVTLSYCILHTVDVVHQLWSHLQSLSIISLYLSCPKMEISRIVQVGGTYVIDQSNTNCHIIYRLHVRDNA